MCLSGYACSEKSLEPKPFSWALLFLSFTGIRVDDKTFNQIIATLTKTLDQNDLFWTDDPKILHRATSWKYTRLRSWSGPKCTPSPQFAYAPINTISHCASLLEKIWQRIHASRFRWTRFCSFCSRITNGTKWSLIALLDMQITENHFCLGRGGREDGSFSFWGFVYC